MLPPSTLDQMPDAFVQLWQQVEEQILQDVARRIGKMDKVTATANWQLWRYQQTEAVRNDVVKLLAKYTGKSETAIELVKRGHRLIAGHPQAAFAGCDRSHGAGRCDLLPLRYGADPL